jgi:23S rRNA pseudouridine955/2504/2580 synthase/23S rRNA pseudouridine1911/1915/1917 synthase
VSQTVKLSSPATSEFWEIPVLYEDAHLLALDKPAGLPVSPDRSDPARPSLMTLLHQGIERQAPWARERSLAYLMNAHRLDPAASGVLLLARDKPTLIALAALFGTESPSQVYVALVRGSVNQSTFACDAKLAPHPLRPGHLRVDPQNGKRSRTEFAVRETFSSGCLLLECRPMTARPHQIRAHLKHLRLPVVGDDQYGGAPLWLSTLKPAYHLKPGRAERPLISRPALHAEQLLFQRPGAGDTVKIQAPWPKDLTVSVKYLRRWSPAG